MDWIKRNIVLVAGLIVVVVFVIGGLATNEPGEGGLKDPPDTKHTGYYEDGDKKYERR